METRGTALLTDEIPATRAVTAIVSREEIAGALQDPGRSPELYLDLNQGEEQSTIGISWSYAELESLFERTSGDEIILTFDRDELQSLFGDVEAHGLRERALIFTVAVAGALGSGATIANAAPTIGDNPGAASVTAVENLAANSIVTAGGISSNVHTPGLQIGNEASAASAPSASVSSAAKVADGGILSNVHTPGLQTGDEASAAPTPSNVSAARSTAADDGVMSNVHTPGLQTGDAASAASTPANVSAAHSTAADDGVMSNVHRPGLQIGPQESTPATPSVQVSAGSDSAEFMGIDTRDATEALIAGGLLLAIAGATFAGTRRPGSARPA
jgi:hypothetical protein